MSRGNHGNTDTGQQQRPQKDIPVDGEASTGAVVDAGCSEKCPCLTAADREKLMSEAATWKGTPYAWYRSSDNKHPNAGGNPKKGSTGGADCSGSVWKIYSNAGFSYGAYKTTLYFPNTVTEGTFEKITEDQLRPGDVVFWPKAGRSTGHMMLYASGTGSGMRVLGARSTGKPFAEVNAAGFDKGRTRVYYRYCKRK